jgi:hypothetical protein
MNAVYTLISYLFFPILILSSYGRRTSTMLEKRRLKDWAWLVHSLIQEATCPSETVRCLTSSSSVLWWSAHAPSEGPCSLVRKLHVLQYKCLRIATNTSWCVGNRQIHEDLGGDIFRRPHQTANCEFRLKVSSCGDSSATWKVLAPTKGWLKSPTVLTEAQQASRGCP